MSKLCGAGNHYAYAIDERCGFEEIDSDPDSDPDSDSDGDSDGDFRGFIIAPGDPDPLWTMRLPRQHTEKTAPEGYSMQWR